MAKQRAVMQALGPKIIPFRDRVEAWVMQLGEGTLPNVVAPGTNLDAIATSPGVYLRLRVANAKDAPTLRAAAVNSLRDGFTSCLFVRHEETNGKECKRPVDCSGGQICNDWGVCARPSQPYNLRLLYRTLRILSSEWTDDLHRASTDLQVRAFELELDAITKNDVPVSIELLSRARYFTAVLDEDPPSGIPEALTDDKGKANESMEERVQRTPHPARVGIWDLRDNKLVLRLRATAGGDFVPMGMRSAASPVTVAAEQRQVNSCALALDVKDAIGAAVAAPAP
ncbi:MAG TPA: hypothetical protein VH062_12350 [Polyangiaceae bacterium]|jgi:hypothetical protein|nr:hypothetical protein [Polyangiaceae bacterium]